MHISWGSLPVRATRAFRGTTSTKTAIGAWRWVSKQRIAHRAGQLDETRSARLASVPGWMWDPHAVDWEEGYSCLASFAAREGHARVPTSRVEDRYPLGEWVGVQRNTYRLGRLSVERATRLEALPGWVWNTRICVVNSAPDASRAMRVPSLQGLRSAS